MGTSGSFTPAAVPACAYAERMTRVAAQALATAGSLDPNCVITVTDGPVIGTTGNTSPTEVTLQPVSATEFAAEGLVHTTFSTEAYVGIYSLAGNIYERLEDKRGNIVDDPTGVLIATQFPWHNANVQRNQVFAPAVLTGWNALPAALNVTDNVISGAGAVVNFTAYAFNGGNFTRNIINRAQVILGAQGGLSFNDNILDDNFTLSSTGTGILVVTSNRIAIGTITLSGSSRLNITNNDLIAPAFTFAGSVGIITVDQTRAVALTLTRNGAATGTFSVLHCEGGHGCTVTQGAGAGAGPLIVQHCTLTTTTVTQNAAAAVTLTQSILLAATIVQNAAGQLFVSFATITTSTITMAGTRALYVQYSHIEGESTITQNRTGSGGSAVGDSIWDSRVSGASQVALNGAAAAAANQSPVKGCHITGGSSVTVSDPDPAIAINLQNSTVEGGAAVTLPANAKLQQRMRFACGCIVNTGPFAHDSTVIEGKFTTTLTASNVGKLQNAGFSNVV